jgi:WD40 repeat protein
MAFSVDNKTLVSASADHTAIIWNIETGEGITLHGHLNEVWAVALAPDGKTLATGIKNEGTVSLWSAVAKPVPPTSRPLSAPRREDSSSQILARDGSAALAVYANGTVGIWDMESLNELAVFPLVIPSGVLRNTHLAISPFGKVLAIGDTSGAIRLLDAATRTNIGTLPEGGAAVAQMTFSPDGKKLAVLLGDRRLQVWDHAATNILVTAEVHPSSVPGYCSAFAFSVDGNWLSIGYEDGTAELLDASTGHRLSLFGQHKAPIAGAALLPDGKTAVTASYDQTVKFWDLSSGKELKTLRGETQANFALALSPDGRRIATGGSEGTVRIWDSENIRLVGMVRVGEGFGALAFSADGNDLVAIGGKAMHRWRAASWGEIEAAEKTTGK